MLNCWICFSVVFTAVKCNPFSFFVSSSICWRHTSIVTPFAHFCAADWDIGWLLMISRITCGFCKITSADRRASQSVLWSTEVKKSSNVVSWAWRKLKTVSICKSGSVADISSYDNPIISILIYKFLSRNNLSIVRSRLWQRVTLMWQKMMNKLFQDVFEVWQMISEMTESKKRQPLYRLVDGLRWVWTCLFCICLYIPYINTLLG